MFLNFCGIPKLLKYLLLAFLHFVFWNVVLISLAAVPFVARRCLVYNVHTAVHALDDASVSKMDALLV